MGQVSEKPNALYLDDLHVGQRFTSDSYQMDENRIKAFASEFDPSRSTLTKQSRKPASLAACPQAVGTPPP
jgi:hypothetical protein